MVQLQVDDQLAPQALMALSHGSLLWQHQQEGWLLATQRQDPALDKLDRSLATSGLVRSELAGDGETLQVWTRLVRERGRGGVEARVNA